MKCLRFLQEKTAWESFGSHSPAKKDEETRSVDFLKVQKASREGKPLAIVCFQTPISWSCLGPDGVLGRFFSGRTTGGRQLWEIYQCWEGKEWWGRPTERQRKWEAYCLLLKCNRKLNNNMEIISERRNTHTHSLIPRHFETAPVLARVWGKWAFSYLYDLCEQWS